MRDIAYVNQPMPSDLARAQRFPFPGALVDVDFRRQRYWWSGAEKLTSDFTSFNLSGATIDRRGLLPSATVDITLALAGLGTFVPGSLAFAFTNTAAPAAQRVFFSIDDGTNNNRIQILQPTNLAFTFAVAVGNVLQAAINPVAIASNALNVCHGAAASWATNDFKAAANFLPATADTAGTVPAPTILRFGRSTVASSDPTGSGILARLALFSTQPTQAELNALSSLIRYA